MLLVVQHPAVGAGLEMLLRLEARSDVTQVKTIDDVDRIAAAPDRGFLARRSAV